MNNSIVRIAGVGIKREYDLNGAVYATAKDVLADTELSVDDVNINGYSVLENTLVYGGDIIVVNASKIKGNVDAQISVTGVAVKVGTKLFTASLPITIGEIAREARFELEGNTVKIGGGAAELKSDYEVTESDVSLGFVRVIVATKLKGNK